MDKPPKIRWGEEPCTHCRMLISDPKFAAALTLQTGEVRKYDDLGCLLKDYAAYRAKTHRVWVRRYDGDEWLNAKQAWFVRGKQLHSPMGYGIAAVRSKDTAKQLASKVKGRMLRFSDL